MVKKLLGKKLFLVGFSKGRQKAIFSKTKTPKTIMIGKKKIILGSVVNVTIKKKQKVPKTARLIHKKINGKLKPIVFFP